MTELLGRFGRVRAAFPQTREAGWSVMGGPGGGRWRAARRLAWVLGLGAAATAAGNLADQSPFAPPEGAAPVPVITTGRSVGDLEFKGVYNLGATWKFYLFDRKGSKGSWVGVGETLNGFLVDSFSPATGQLILVLEGNRQVLQLQDAGEWKPQAVEGQPQAPVVVEASPAAPAPPAVERRDPNSPTSRMQQRMQAHRRRLIQRDPATAPAGGQPQSYNPGRATPVRSEAVPAVRPGSAAAAVGTVPKGANPGQSGGARVRDNVGSPATEY